LSNSHKGEYERSWIGYAYKDDDFTEWSDNFSCCVALGILLFDVHLKQWEAVRSSSALFCPIYHSQNFHVSSFWFGGKEFTEYHCIQCGDQMTLNDEGYRAYRVELEEKIYYVSTKY